MDAYTGEIRMIAGIYAPRGWALCDGRILQVREYQILFALFGRTYGGNGITTFGLPDLRGRLPAHCESGSSTWQRGYKVGREQETLSPAQMASHNHPMQASRKSPNSRKVANNIICNTKPVKFYRPSPSAPDKETSLCPLAVDFIGGDAPHNNLMPYQCINFIVCLEGEWPPRPES
ncbi:MAG: tail fiber protein [Victivallaceae bacterium]|nr:tail fiber protein [Victivallaceae bacterium]